MTLVDEGRRPERGTPIYYSELRSSLDRSQ